jgi:hypothetical protein
MAARLGTSSRRRRRGILVRVDAVGPVDAVSERVFADLHRHKADALAAGAARGR